MNKIFKTLDEQIAILKDKGMIIDDEFFAKEVLLRENYFFLNGYRMLFMKSPTDKTFVLGANFREFYGVFNFDRQIRNILFKNLLILENNLKSIISYHLSRTYGIKEADYLNPNNFNRDIEKKRQVNDLINKMKRQIRMNADSHTATAHYQNNYGYIPLWIAVKVLSFGIVGELFIILKPNDQREIAEIFQVDSDDLEMYLPILSNFRNLCAHEEILFDHRVQRKINDTSFHSHLEIPKLNNEYIYGKNDLFCLIIILKQLLRKDDFKMMLKEIDYEIQKLDGKLESISIGKVLDRMGFPSNYLEIEGMN
ncbi:MAG: Abi family protein [Bacilli bacterium]|nr:Abi family protein [Bacilli bacterium]